MKVFAAYIFCLVEFVAISPLVGLLLLFIPGVARVRLLSFVAFFIQTFIGVYIGFLFCQLLNISFSPLMFLLPGVLMVQNDIRRISEARKGRGGGNVRLETDSTVADITGLLSGLLFVTLYMMK